MATLVLDARSIVESLSSVGVDITVDDIIHPVASRIQSIYFGFCTKVLGVPEKSLSELPFECQLNPETAEMHQKSTPLLLLFTTMQCFIIDFGETNADFTMCDLINPTPKRTRKLLSLLADYTNFHRLDMC
ncbi:unnamed protein product [Heligmosomoides polygyrus]|uniref:Nuf2 domain-containing protein n=1 Tax=Heligmosomoides polygyrus TaxID=6339 RepID=A0A183FRM3_HELPZ|nr:unnamed protein product [Heligmosomoides polygyrus]